MDRWNSYCQSRVTRKGGYVNKYWKEWKVGNPRDLKVGFLAVKNKLYRVVILIITGISQQIIKAWSMRLSFGTVRKTSKKYSNIGKPTPQKIKQS